MKIHFEEKEKQTIRDLNKKLIGKSIEINNMKEGISQLIDSKNFDILRNTTNDIRYDYVLYYYNIEIGLSFENIDNEYLKIKEIYWNEH